MEASHFNTLGLQSTFIWGKFAISQSFFKSFNLKVSLTQIYLHAHFTDKNTEALALETLQRQETLEDNCSSILTQEPNVPADTITAVVLFQGAA